MAVGSSDPTTTPIFFIIAVSWYETFDQPDYRAFQTTRASELYRTTEQYGHTPICRFPAPPSPQCGGLDLNSSNRGCARLGGEVDPPLGLVVEKVAVLIVLVCRHRRAVGVAVRRAVGDEVPGVIEEETGPAAVRRVPPGLLDALPVDALGALGIVV